MFTCHTCLPTHCFYTDKSPWNRQAKFKAGFFYFISGPAFPAGDLVLSWFFTINSPLWIRTHLEQFMFDYELCKRS